jgi:hypothetical protein
MSHPISQSSVSGTVRVSVSLSVNEPRVCRTGVMGSRDPSQSVGVTVPSTLGLPPLDRRGHQPRGRPDGAG